MLAPAVTRVRQLFALILGFFAACALAGGGVTGVGVWIILAAIADPEPTSKLGLLIAGGLLLGLTGSLGTLAACGVKFSVSAKTRGGSFTIDPK